MLHLHKWSFQENNQRQETLNYYANQIFVFFKTKQKYALDDDVRHGILVFTSIYYCHKILLSLWEQYLWAKKLLIRGKLSKSIYEFGYNGAWCHTQEYPIK